MAKDPAFLFYSSDFLNGVADLTMEERGQFITLLCLQHQKGTLTDKTIRLSLGSVSVDVLSKFLKDKDGNFYNERLSEEIEKRIQFTESRRNNGSKGGRPKNNTKALGLAKHNLMEDVNENENEDINNNESITKLQPLNKKFCKFEEAIEHFSIRLGIDKGKIEAEKFYNYYESNGWRVGKNPMKNWKAAANNWITNSNTYAKGTTNNQRKLTKGEQFNLDAHNRIYSTSYGAGDYDRIFGGTDTESQLYHI
jgi:uncharacterized protein YdaU (DUF1376 family)